MPIRLDSRTALAVAIMAGMIRVAAASAQTQPAPADSVQQWSQRLTSGDLATIRTAADRLVAAGAVEPLRNGLGATTGHAVASVLRDLGEPGLQVLATVAVDTASRGSYAARMALGVHLGGSSPDLDGFARRLAADPRPSARALAMGMLSPGYGDQEEDRFAANLPMLRAGLTDSSAVVRRAAAEALAKPYGAAAPAAGELATLLADPDQKVRESAVKALGWLRGPERAIVVPALARAVRQDASETIRWRSAEALGFMGDPAAAEPLMAAATERADNVRHSATLALGELAGHLTGSVRVRSLATVRALSTHADSLTRGFAVQAAAEFGPEADTMLARAVRDRSVRPATTAIGLLSRRALVPATRAALYGALADPRAPVRHAAADAFANQGAPEKPRLDSLVRRGGPGAEAAASALRVIRELEVIPVAGRCYSLARGPWSPPADLGADSVFTSIPTRVRFTTWSIPPSPGRRNVERRMEVQELDGESRPTFATWSGTAEKVTAVWSNGFSGVSVELVPEGERLSGTARTFWDFTRNRQSAPVTGVRIPCP